MRRRAPALLLLLVLPLPPAEAESPLSWSFVLAPDPARGLVRVEVGLEGMEGAVTRFTFRTEGRREPVTNVTPGPATVVRPAPEAGGFEVLVDGPESFSYDVDVRRPAPRPGEALAHVGPAFALFKAEAVALAYAYEYHPGRLRENRTTVRLVPPPGWQAAGPWDEPEPGTFVLPPDAVVPRGFVAFGPFEAWENRTIAGKRASLVRLGAAAPFEADLWAYLERATGYMEAVYGPTPERRLLVVTAPDPMLRGGLGASGSLVVHETADLRTVAHEHAHVHQRFGPREDAGESAIWFTEGDADWHGALSLHAAGFWTTAQTNEFLREAERDRDDPALRDAHLPDATYGGTREGRSLERFAYHKGMTVLRALDARMRDATGGAVGVPDLLRRLNEVHGNATRTDLVVETSDVAVEASRLAGADLSPFFARYVLGTEWPDAPPFAPAGDLTVTRLRLDPPRAAEGASVTLSVGLANQGTRPASRPVDVTVDGRVVLTLDVTLGVGEARTLHATLVAGPPGDHEVRVLHDRVTLRSLTPASLRIGNVSVVPASPRAGEPFEVLVFVENAGESPGEAVVEARVAGARAAAVDVHVAPGGTSVAVLPLRLDAPGNATLDLRLAGAAGEGTRERVVAVGPPREREDAPVGAAAPLAALAAAALLRRVGIMISR